MTTKNKKGFTIIEVVLVLAIAGLIFLMVFIALPALQRSQRNTQRENDLSRFLTAANDYQTNNSGKTPFGTEGNAFDKKFVARYIDDTCGGTAKEVTAGMEDPKCSESSSQFRDPDGTPYQFILKGKLAANENNANGGETEISHKIYVYVNASCGSENQAVKGTGVRQYALFYTLEGGSVTCNDNH